MVFGQVVRNCLASSSQHEIELTMKTSQPLDVSPIRFKRLFSALAVGSLLLSGILGGGTRAAYGDLTNVWSDEFNGTSIDLSKWTFDTGHGGSNPGWGNNELEYYTDRTNNAYVAGGMLHIRAQIEVTNSSEGTFRYTSARMKTQGLFNKKYGRIEWRAKLPAGTGMWPAIWALGSNIVSSPWPDCGEIDVVENNGANTGFVQGSLHSTAGDPTAVYNFTGGDSVTNFHVYDLDWTNSTVVWSVDGVPYETQPTTTAFNLPFFFLLNLAVGGNYVGNPATGAIDPNMPGELVIDYMRVFDYVTPVIPPSTPTGLTATPGGSQVGLNWNAAANAANYNVKRANVSGGPYTTIASPTSVSYTDTGVVNCATYYYVVSGTNTFGESTNSIEASATLGSYSVAVNSGGNATGQFIADAFVTGGTVAAPTAAAISTTGLTNPAPQAVYQTERYGNFTYTFTGLTPGANYTVRLHLVEYYWTGANMRRFNVSINGTQVLTSFDIFAAAGGQNKALIREYTATPNGGNQIVIAYAVGTVDQPKSSGIEIILPPPAAPTGLSAFAGDQQIALNWSTVTGATGYNVKRSTVSTGPYAIVTNGVTGTSFTDTGLTDGTTYYYVVTTLKGSCESGNSAAANATPLSAFEQWQMQYFGSFTNPAAAANADADGTGQNNLFKYVAGLDPTNPASVFVLNVAGVTDQPTQFNLFFSPVCSNRTYTPQFSMDLVSSNWSPLTGYAGPVTNGNQVTITDQNATESNKFYRIDISSP